MRRKRLGAFDEWAVRSNIKRVVEEGADAATIVQTIRANGYLRVAAAVEHDLEELRREAVRQAGDKLVQEYLDNREANRPAVEMAREERDREFYDEMRRDGI